MTDLPWSMTRRRKSRREFLLVAQRHQDRRARLARPAVSRWRNSRRDQRRPWPAAIAGALVLILLALPVLGLRLGFSDEGNYPQDTTTRKAYDLLADGFGPGFNGPLVLTSLVPGDLDPAVLDRVTTRLASPAFDDNDLGVGWRFPEAWDGHTTLTWDLSSIGPARRLLRLTCDPLVGEAGTEVVRDHQAPPLTDGRETVLVHTTVPEGTAGLVAVSVRLTAPPVPPARPFEAEVSGLLKPPEPRIGTTISTSTRQVKKTPANKPRTKVG